MTGILFWLIGAAIILAVVGLLAWLSDRAEQTDETAPDPHAYAGMVRDSPGVVGRWS